ncbi:DNA polymerase III, subunit gamma and tau [Candidatus Saccharibacteria bacterium CG_4_10_14_0_2_um_filter_52_9]|nr:MAG: DNA polymerase III, subunit gamma and tau [Candidatus Saccharibacteria bacterium CG_4_10_14_0_2_um_filter_52_9]
MGQALYRKHRPKSLGEVVGQEHITDTLKQALAKGRISHAYLFTGPRGVGKTSIARILAHEINNLPYTDDSAHLDIIEIDAASNRRIDEIRELRDKVYVAPTSAKYKVYIIDEVHMLTREAFNALLKTLEEPPQHAVFILATTDAHKLPDTIVSRTQRFNFRPVEKSKVVAHLQQIAKQEKIKVSDSALELLAEHGEGSFRDSISLLDQASSRGQALEVDDIQQLLGIPPQPALQAVIQLLSGGSSVDLSQQLSQLYDQGYQAAAVAKQLGQLLREQVIGGQSAIAPDVALALLARLIAVPAAHDPERFLEICLLQSLQTPITTQEAPQAPQAAPAKPASVKAAVADVETPAKPKPGSAALDASLWPQLLGALKKKHNTLYGVVRMAEPSFDEDGSLTLSFAFAFHKKRLDEVANRQTVAAIVEELTGQPVTIVCVLDKTAKPSKTPVLLPEEPPTQDLSAISNIFGAAELLES